MLTVQLLIYTARRRVESLCLYAHEPIFGDSGRFGGPPTFSRL